MEKTIDKKAQPKSNKSDKKPTKAEPAKPSKDVAKSKESPKETIGNRTRV